MPLYSFTAPDGDLLLLEYKIHDKRPEKIRRKTKTGKTKTFTRNVAADHLSFDHTYGRGWPIFSDSMGVHPSQIDQAKATDKQLGVPADYKPDGRIVFNNREHQHRWLRAHGYVNFGDIR